MKSSAIALFIDSFWRDAVGLGLIAAHLEKMGHEVHVVPFSLWNEYTTLMKPSVAVINHGFGVRNQSIIKRQAENGGKTVLLFTEGRPNSIEQMKWFSSQANCGAGLALHWSKQTFDGWPKDAMKKVAIGCPRFDVYHWYPELIASPQEVIDSHRLPKDFLLAVSSFPQAKFAYMMSEFHAADSRDLSVPFDPVDVPRQEFAHRSKFLGEVLVHEGGNTVFRPHPMEDASYWSAHGPVVTQEFLHNLLNAADTVLNRAGCTSTVEMWMLEKDGCQSILLEDRIDKASPSLESHFVANDAGERQKYMRKWGFSKQRKPSSLLAALEIDKLADESTSTKIPFTDIEQWNNIVVQHNNAAFYPNLSQVHLGKDAARSNLNKVIDACRKVI